MADPILITQLHEGDQGIVYSIEGGAGLTSRLAGMGLVTNAKFKIAQVSGGLIVIQVADTTNCARTGRSRKNYGLSDPGGKSRCLHTCRRKGNICRPCRPAQCRQINCLQHSYRLSQHVGNWPGKTIEKKEGQHQSQNTLIRIVDLPGTYSLTAFSEEERIAREFIIKQKPDLVVLVLNAAALERSLYLLSEVLLLNRPVIVALNMLDVASQQGIQIDTRSLQDSLGIPVIPMIAKRNNGIRELVSEINAFAAGDIKPNPRPPQVSADHRLFTKQYWKRSSLILKRRILRNGLP